MDNVQKIEHSVSMFSVCVRCVLVILSACCADLQRRAVLFTQFLLFYFWYASFTQM
jgi:hypothetical protein